MIDVDSPAPRTIVSNGQNVDIGGWTTGSRVDVYLDGPAGVGRGIGSDAVDGVRPDVARATGSAMFGSSGFDVAWQPVDLAPGEHWLWIYSSVNGVWALEKVPVIAEGNIPMRERERDRDADRMSDQPAATTDSSTNDSSTNDTSGGNDNSRGGDTSPLRD
jgi:hypothetical protein